MSLTYICRNPDCANYYEIGESWPVSVVSDECGDLADERDVFCLTCGQEGDEA